MSYVITFLNSNDAVAAEYALAEDNIPASVMPLLPQLGKGCGICLRLAPDEIDNAKKCMSDKGIRPANIYYRTPNDTKGFEYVVVT